MLIVMAGLPGAGKSALSVELAGVLRCALLSVDPVEAAMWRAGVSREEPTGMAAYVVVEDLAREQLMVGNDVIVDAVNDVEPARQQWRSLADRLDVPFAFVEVFCSDEREHERRLTARRRDIPGFPEPSWASVSARRVSFEEWEEARLRVDSMQTRSVNLAMTLEYLTDRGVRMP
ncbi:AAA family ATPase [Curtobacterium sp. BRB10]|uniref:AAA family ATPase n=1 Tax=Curtobacterium sp. BRB10 TaxID=2962579 RepID=UPI002882AEA7|nr:AAA family ATPase [Curtobacterium sp. BRB10]MDT0235365.1 AAA family ATPase [Curtobacterium sp. BRB10]